MGAQVRSRPLQSRGTHGACASPTGGTRGARHDEREEVSTVPPATPQAVPAVSRAPHEAAPIPEGTHVWDKEEWYAVCDGRPETDCVRGNTRPYQREARAASPTPSPARILAH